MTYYTKQNKPDAVWVLSEEVLKPTIIFAFLSSKTIMVMKHIFSLIFQSVATTEYKPAFLTDTCTQYSTFKVGKIP